MKRMLAFVLLALLLAVWVGAGAPPSTVQAPPSDVIITQWVGESSAQPGTYFTVTFQESIYQDPKSGRFVLLGSAGGATDTSSWPPGVPQTVMIPFRLPQAVPFTGSYCLDTFKLGSKQTPANAAAQSILALSSIEGKGRPSLSVLSNDGDVHVGPICYGPGDAPPQMWLINNAGFHQVMTYALAGEVR